MFLQAHKQRMKLQMFQRLWRILIIAVIAIAAFFVVSSMSLSNRLDEGGSLNSRGAEHTDNQTTLRTTGGTGGSCSTAVSPSSTSPCFPVSPGSGDR
jgi:hypothetical protein